MAGNSRKHAAGSAPKNECMVLCDIRDFSGYVAKVTPEGGAAKTFRAENYGTLTDLIREFVGGSDGERFYLKITGYSGHDPVVFCDVSEGSRPLSRSYVVRKVRSCDPFRSYQEWQAETGAV